MDLLVKNLILMSFCTASLVASADEHFRVDKSDRLLVKTPLLVIRTDSNQVSDNDADRLVSFFDRLQNITSDFVQPNQTRVLLNDSQAGGGATPESNYFQLGLRNFRLGEIPFFAFAHEFGHLIFKNPDNLKSVRIKQGSHCYREYYNEFFADVVAALATGNPAIAKEENLKFFGRQVIGQGFLKDDPKLTIDKKKGLFPDLYQYFYSSRRLIWDYFLENGRSVASARRILKSTYEAIGQVVQKSDCVRDGLHDQAELNQIDRELFDEVSTQLNRSGFMKASGPPLAREPSPKDESALTVR